MYKLNERFFYNRLELVVIGNIDNYMISETYEGDLIVFLLDKDKEGIKGQVLNADESRRVIEDWEATTYREDEYYYDDDEYDTRRELDKDYDSYDDYEEDDY